jgi:urease accessory protein
LHIDDTWCLKVNIKPCDCIVVLPKTIVDMGIICFEIGNQHIPIFITENNSICVAYEAPLYNALEKSGYHPIIEQRKLLKTHVLKLNTKKMW